jgi:hypothetical protein
MRQIRFETKGAEALPSLYRKIRDIPAADAIVPERFSLEGSSEESIRHRVRELVTS